jgi:putative transposase
MEMVRLNLYNKGLFISNQPIQGGMNDIEVRPFLSLTTICRIIRRRELTHRWTRRYTPKGKKYPELPALLPNQTHQVDMVGSCYLTGLIKSYSLHAVDTAVKRRGIELIPSSPVQRKAFWTLFMRFGCVCDVLNVVS